MKKLVSLLLICVFPSFLFANVEVSNLFSEGAVLQQKASVPVWGWAPEGTKVSVTFKGQTKNTIANSSGDWRVTLEPMTASAVGASMTIKSDQGSKVINDILIGEVWLCGGQSNMEFRLAWLCGLDVNMKDKLSWLKIDKRNPKYEVFTEYILNEIKTANDPLLRVVNVAKKISPDAPQKNTTVTWLKAVPGQIQHFNGTGYFFARELRKKLGVPVGLLNSTWGGTRVQPWISKHTYESSPIIKDYFTKEMATYKNQLQKWDPAKNNKLYQAQVTKWKEKVILSKKNGTKAPRKPRKQAKPGYKNSFPTALYNGMIAPLVPYALKGAIWYQGESNSKYHQDEYKKFFTSMTKGWRQDWGQDKFHFYWCQLAQFKYPSKEPIEEHGWVTICDQLRLSLQDLNDVGMAVLNDVGEEDDIHPKNKMEAGRRLSLWALKQAYHKNITASGPLYKSSEIQGNKVIITFDHVGEGLMVGKKPLMKATVEVNEPLKRFQIRGTDNKWYWADAKITGKNKVEVYHKEVVKPIEVRYAWAINAEGANLYNKAGLPASLFKTK
ncbi:MAG: 9-O-acetylesterase [Lentisphaeraceae bacterium]|nr:9-O-acetylesterase [Lentisphaeraceae bacterium]